MKIKISQAIYTDYVKRLSQDPLAFPKAWPGQVGVVDLDDDLAEMVQKDAEAMSGITTSPTMATAYRSLAMQIKKSMENTQTQENVSHAKHATGLVMLEASQISTGDNVRTVFDQASIEELAEDIKAHGLINPITVRMNNGHYILVAGERRMRACELAGVPILAKVLEVDAQEAKRIQLAENIHREDLSLEDKAHAVRELYEQLGTMKAVADQVKKSKAWVSKLIGLTEPDLGYRAGQLLTNGVVEDLEILGIMSRIESSCPYADAEEAYVRILEGNFTRDEAREFLKQRSEKYKERLEKIEAKRKADKERWEEAQLAEHKARQEERLAKEASRPPRREFLSMKQAIAILLRFYVTTQLREHEGEILRIVTEFSDVPFIGDGVGESFQNFRKEDIMQAWRDLVEAYAHRYGEIMTEEYFQEVIA